uniref:Uncharacterized protein n=1 Tax=Eutreptiella gymnastica TaxID=73025 RepID=A0A7S1IX62_9EUGL
MDPVAAGCTFLFLSLPPIAWLGWNRYLRWVVLPAVIGLLSIVLFYVYPRDLRSTRKKATHQMARAILCGTAPVGLYFLLLAIRTEVSEGHLLSGLGLAEAGVVIALVVGSGLPFDMWLYRRMLRCAGHTAPSSVAVR